MSNHNFKLGNRIEILPGSSDRDNQRNVGKIGTIDYLAGDFASVDFDDGSRAGGINLLDVRALTSGEPHMGRRTFKQLQESVTVKKNALWQEACDDGDQEYILLDGSFNKDSRNTQKIYDRSLVEEDTKHFVEVFKVNPEYMTREELDKWEAFQGRKKPGPKPRTARDVHVMYSGDLPIIGLRSNKTGRTWTPAQRRAHSRKLKAVWAAKKAA